MANPLTSKKDVFKVPLTVSRVESMSKEGEMSLLVTGLCLHHAHQLPVALWTVVFSLQRACPKDLGISPPADKAGEGILGGPGASMAKSKVQGGLSRRFTPGPASSWGGC